TDRVTGRYVADRPVGVDDLVLVHHLDLLPGEDVATAADSVVCDYLDGAGLASSAASPATAGRECDKCDGSQHDGEQLPDSDHDPVPSLIGREAFWRYTSISTTCSRTFRARRPNVR